jgi:hypothetical protein
MVQVWYGPVNYVKECSRIGSLLETYKVDGTEQAVSLGAGKRFKQRKGDHKMSRNWNCVGV